MKLTLITEDNLVSVNDEYQHFDYSDLIDNRIRAVQWNNFSGEVEFTTGETNQPIKSINAFLPIIDRFEKNKKEIDTIKQISLYKIQKIYKSGEIKIISYKQALSENLTFRLISTEKAKEEKKLVTKLDGIKQLGKLYGSNYPDYNSYKVSIIYNAIISKDTNPSLCSSLHEVIMYLDLLDEEYNKHINNINTLLTMDEIVNYNVDFSPVPGSLSDKSNIAVKYIKQLRI